ncbi:hypothetical protein LTR07_008676 [Exophiala xenobiotica]|nr:hypothetical protein LTR41_007193 [Exophiala xenobiotica]KAK5512647.1 hypothetical protein LTR07_008676 [Exophiala xenobiotica]
MPEHRTWTRDGFLISTDPSLVPVPALQQAFDSEDIYWARSIPESAMRAMLDNSLVFGVYSPTPSPPVASDLDLDDTTTGSTTHAAGQSDNDPATTLHEIAESVHVTTTSKPVGQGQGQGHGQAGHESQSGADGGGGDGGGDTGGDTGEEGPSLIGFARGITDRVTFFYLTDVYLLPEWQGQGLGKWLVQCVQEVVEDMPYLRRSMCVVGHGREGAQAFYGKLMKMERLGEDTVPLHWRGPGCTF